MAVFEEMGVIPELIGALGDLEWELPTDIQAEAIPLILGGGDVLMAAETGAGKTGAFSLPVVQIVWEVLKDSTNVEGKPVVELKMSVYDRSKFLAISPDGYTAQSRDQKQWNGCRATRGAVSGKHYFEAKVTDEGLCRVGWSIQEAVLDLGCDNKGYGYGGTGKKSFFRSFENYGESFGINDVIGCFLDLDNGTIKWSKNGKDFGNAFTIESRLRGQTFFPAVALKNAEMSFNFGHEDFRHPPTDGYTALLAAAELINNDINGLQASSQSKESHAPIALVLEPSIELAEQTSKCLETFAKVLQDPPVRCLCITSRTGVQEQLAALNEGVDIVVGTPGRIDDLIKSRKLTLNQCRFFILDEADGLLSGGHKRVIDNIHARIPKVCSDGKRFQMIVCSATLHSSEAKQLEKIMNFPTWVDLKGEDSVPETVHHVACLVDPIKDESWKVLRDHIQTDGVHRRNRDIPEEQLSEAVKILKAEYCIRAIKKHEMDMGIIFCRTKVDCDNLENYFKKLGSGPNSQLSCVALHSDRSPEERRQNLEAFKKKQVRFLICTDVAARGIDVTGIPYVINMTLPDMKENYLHRIGRVGRANRMGLAISLVSSVPEKVWYHSSCNRARNCTNTELKDDGGCCIWFDESSMLGDIEEHLKETVSVITNTFHIPINEFDGNVVYGAKKKAGSKYSCPSHVAQMAHTVSELADLEYKAQLSYLSLVKGVS